jgi:hypothetical protein
MPFWVRGNPGWGVTYLSTYPIPLTTNQLIFINICRIYPRMIAKGNAKATFLDKLHLQEW